MKSADSPISDFSAVVEQFNPSTAEQAQWT